MFNILEQHTPKPDAQDPMLLPPLLLHSSLKTSKILDYC